MAGNQAALGKNGVGLSFKFASSGKSRTATAVTSNEQNPGLSYPSLKCTSIKSQQCGDESCSIVTRAGVPPSPQSPVLRKSFGDRRRTSLRYEASLQTFEMALQSQRTKGKRVDPPNFQIAGGDPIPSLRATIDKMLRERQPTKGEQDLWSKGKTIMEKVFTSLSPLTKSLLGIAEVTASTISGAEPFGLVCAGLSVLIEIAEREASRRKDIEKRLDYISRQLGALQIIERLPDAGVETDQLVNRALDVISAALNYLSAHILRERRGIFRSVLCSLPVGDRQFGSVEPDLKAAVEEFNSAFVQFGHGVGFKVFNLLQGAIAEGRVEPQTPDSSNERSIIPYRRNSMFTGRQNLLKTLRQMLFSENPRRQNHRVALYGLGGVGKTQIALEYVYSQRDYYHHIYWISAANEGAIFSGFQEIAIRMRWIHPNASLPPKAFVSVVLKNLNKQKNWLLVFDNLEDFETIDSYLPDVAPDKHTLVTTRNPNYHQIPAEGLEVTVLDVDEAKELLLTRSNVSPKPRAQAEAVVIVRELGCLPLAIEQAAAYIRETLKDIFKYLTSYRKSRKSHHERRSKANRNYYGDSIATTWNLSFRQLNDDAAQLLRLMAFLNPDGILTEFLEAGKEGLSARFKEVISDCDRFSEALSELERFSLIRRQDDPSGGQLITVHRLVQLVIKDSMTSELFSDVSVNAMELCISGFPEGDFQDHLKLMKCRRYYTQVMFPLSAVRDIDISTLGCLLHRLGVFLAADGKFRESVQILEWARDATQKTLGNENINTLIVATDLAWVYYEDGRLADSLQLAEEVLAVRLNLGGAEDDGLLSIMGGVAGLYCARGWYQIAAEKQADVVAKSERLLGAEHRDTLRAVEILSLIFVLQGRWTAAAKLQEGVLESRKRQFGDDSLLTYAALANLAGIYQYQGKYEAARQLTEPVVEARVRLLGDHPWTFWAKMSLGTVWAECGRLDESLEMLVAASDGLISTLGSEHPMTLIANANLGYAYSDHGNLDESIKILESTIEVTKRVSGDEHFYTLWMKECLAEVYHEQVHGLIRSTQLLAEVVEGRRRTLGESHCMTMASTTKLSRWQTECQKVQSPDTDEELALGESRSRNGTNRPLRLRNTGAWLTFSVKPVTKWKELEKK